MKARSRSGSWSWSCSCIVFNLLLFMLPITTMARKVTNPAKVPKNAILLSKVASLTLRQDKKTSSRRVSPIPQLTCVGPASICKLYNINTMRCTNEGADYEAENIQWSCKASLPPDFKLGSTEVMCEGYESSDDPYVLKGSCGVQYRLVLTDVGHEKYGRHHDHDTRDRGASGWARFLFFAIFFLVVLRIVSSCWTSWQGNSARRRPPPAPRPPRRPGGGGFGGNNDDDDPPPPYDDHRPYPSKSSTWSTSARGSGSHRAGAQREQAAWRPGFWTGAATGAAAGYLAGNRGQQRTRTQEQAPTQQRQSASWFGRREGGSSSSSFSTSRYESTGFGGTTRR